MAKVVILENACKGCYLCINACPKKVLGESENLNAKGYKPAAVLNPDACIGCSMCATTCPDCAIEVYK